ncbi:Non-LTR retroelement reverse transcriptase-like protein [Tieghemostelium lacteum]|uniref:Non-LTR retroelement reverse transcriptase-like protein n=1 Tax=Tieghemostelium lacteum TaxID=361077 RepID=A0A152A2T8_TIELA|nr:Non-LTR retroelement reverse transcriptase-like protein [Tieghemostelium lacteum]|eukprot:KYR00381.1 Non-LTR retroelement reverse transcriptase-like protein [Tieghemostelium lacteum]
MWDLELRQEAFKIWNMNRLLCIHFDRECNEVQQWYIQQVTTGRIVSSILRNQMEAWKDYRTNHAATMPKLNKLNEETEDVKWVNGIRNMSNRPIKLRDIYANLVIKKYTSIRLTDGQKNLRYNININGIFQKISKVIHHKGRNTLFRFFARCLPGINHQRMNCPIDSCRQSITDPYVHFFFQCNVTTSYAPAIVQIVNHLSFKKIHLWNIHATDLTTINKTEKVYPNLISIVMHQMWKIVCYNLFETDKETKPIPEMNTAIIQKELIDTINTAKWKLLKYLAYQSKIKSNNDDVLLKSVFNRSWQTPLKPLPIPHN